MVCICHHCHPESMLGRNFVFLLPKKITGNQKAISGILSTCYLKKLQSIRKQFSANGPHQRNKRAKPPKSTEDFDKVTTFLNC